MHVELLVVPDCPHESTAYELTLAALADVGGAAYVQVTVIESDAQAQARGFTGSPTFLIDGRDPFARAGAAVGMACRMYWTPDGPSGVPSVEELREALRRIVTA